MKEELQMDPVDNNPRHIHDLVKNEDEEERKKEEDAEGEIEMEVR